MRAIDRLQPYRAFFRRRWLLSLLHKSALFPDLYDLNPMRELHTVWAMTEWLIPRYSPYADAEDYFNHYRVLPSDYERIEVKTTVIAAEDDYVIPVQDFHEIPRLPLVDVRIYRTGGHMGFVDVLPYRQWLPRAVLDLLRAA
jgi:predicted alpha/beta-fold hydrolase